MPRRTPRLISTFLLTLRIGKEKNTPILRFACIFSNAAYMGFPLIQALFGAEGLLYASAYVTVFNILLWTVGYAMVNGKVRPGEVLHSILTTPVLWSVLLGLILYLCRVNVPELIRQPLQAGRQHEHTALDDYHRYADCRQQAGKAAGQP